MPKNVEKNKKIKKGNTKAPEKNVTKNANVKTQNKKCTAVPQSKSKVSEKNTNSKSANKNAIPKKTSNKPKVIKIMTEKKDAKKNNRIIKEDDLRKEKEQKEKKAKVKNKEYLQEYYDLPYRYDDTVVTILAQTPKRLFVYWDVSDKDKDKYRNAFGDDFFEKTYPVLLIHSEDLNYTFEVPINDFANSWYLDINDSKSKYVVQLGRKFRNVNEARKADIEKVREESINLQNDFIYITDSNKLEVPNDHILFEKLGNQVAYRNLKDGSETTKDISSIVSKLQEAYPNANIKDLYKELYGDEFSVQEGFDISNPSSGGMPTSGFIK